jgi:hypothetical protein
VVPATPVSGPIVDVVAGDTVVAVFDGPVRLPPVIAVVNSSLEV